MAESKAAWDQVGEDFKALGRQMKQHYDQRPRPEGADGGQGEEGAAQHGRHRRAERPHRQAMGGRS